jgi:2-polyprenyl-3-methyl-5-hydroxy-6-metoxy-1,4-benzoquinol methylase
MALVMAHRPEDPVRRLTAHLPWLTRRIQRLRPRICPFRRVEAAVPPGARVLDVGCGSGLLLGLLAERGRISTGIGIDANAAAIRAAQGLRGLPLTFIQQAAEEPWPAGPFGAIVLNDVLHHVPPAAQRAVVAQAAAALAPGGTLVIKDMAVRPRVMAAMNQLHDLVMARQWIHHVAGATIAAWAQQLGLRVAPVERFHRWWYAHELVVAQRP